MLCLAWVSFFLRRSSLYNSMEHFCLVFFIWISVISTLSFAVFSILLSFQSRLGLSPLLLFSLWCKMSPSIRVLVDVRILDERLCTPHLCCLALVMLVPVHLCRITSQLVFLFSHRVLFFHRRLLVSILL